VPWFLVVDFEVSLMAKIERVFNNRCRHGETGFKASGKGSTFNVQLPFGVLSRHARASAMGVQCLY